jgi:nucleoside-diphosphate-sugar epimerase
LAIRLHLYKGEKHLKILITSATALLARSLADLLSGEHQIRLTAQTQVKCEHEFVLCALDHDASSNLLVRGMDAIVHVGEPLPESGAGEQIDYLTRCTYNLLMAATAEGVSKVVYLSSLDLMTDYDKNYIVDERWRPLPRPEPPTLSKYLGESTCKEFAREGKLNVVILRLGQTMRVEDGQKPSASVWVDERDVAQAICKALTTDTTEWAIYHVEVDAPHARFSIAKAKSELGFQPHYNGITT